MHERKEVKFAILRMRTINITGHNSQNVKTVFHLTYYQVTQIKTKNYHRC